jgi:LmbE family N-acetylglucosaminyl deacetylase
MADPLSAPMAEAPTTHPAPGPLPAPERALAIGAHPDDVEFQAGATLARWAAEGCRVDLVVCTDGSKGTWDPDADLADLVATRQAEQRDAARAMGVRGEIVFLGWVDGEVEANRARVSEVAREIRRLRPYVVLTHDPWKRYRWHPDHRNVGWVALDAIVAARDPHFFPEHGLPHHRPDAVLLFEPDEPDHVEDVSGYADAKIDALLAHRSQFESTMHITAADTDAVAAFGRRIVARLAEVGRPHGYHAAEHYKLMHP